MGVLLKFHEVDPWLRFNPHVYRGYRPRMSVGEALRSFFRWHNESFNVWSHALAACLVLYLIVFPPVEDLLAGNEKVLLQPRIDIPSDGVFLPSADPVTVFRITCVAALLGFLSSVGHHLFRPCVISDTVWLRLCSCEVLGTVMLTTGTAWSFLYRGNACVSLSTSHWMAFLLLISSAAALFVALRRGISMAHSARGTFAGLLCVPNMGLMLWIEFPKAYTEGHYTAVNYHLLSCMFILIGAYIGYSNFPEAQISQATCQWSKGANRRHTISFRCWRWIGRYLLSRNDLDYTWNSHNIWHYCVMLGVVAKLFGCRYDVVEFELTRCTL